MSDMPMTADPEAFRVNPEEDAGIQLLAEREAPGNLVERFLPCPSFGIFSAAPDVSQSLFFLQFATYLQNGLPLFDWGVCERHPAAVLSFDEEPRLLRHLLQQLLRGLNTPAEAPAVYGLRENRRKDGLESAVLGLARTHKVIFVEGGRTMFPCFRDYVLAMKGLAYRYDICLIGAYISRLSFETPRVASDPEAWRESLRKPLSHATFSDEDFDATALADWLCIAVQVPRTAINAILVKEQVKDTGANRRFYALKFLGAEGHMPDGLRFLSRTRYPLFSTIQVQSALPGAGV